MVRPLGPPVAAGSQVGWGVTVVPQYPECKNCGNTGMDFRGNLCFCPAGQGLSGLTGSRGGGSVSGSPAEGGGDDFGVGAPSSPPPMQPAEGVIAVPVVVKCRRCGNSGVGTFGEPCSCIHGRKRRALNAAPKELFDADRVRAGAIAAGRVAAFSSPSTPPPPLSTSVVDLAGSGDRSSLTSPPRDELSQAIASGLAEGVARLGLAAPTDLTPILIAIDELGHKELHLSLQENHSEVIEAITNVSVAPPDLTQIAVMLQSLRIEEKHREVLEAIQGIGGKPMDFGTLQRTTQGPQMARMFQSLQIEEKHAEVMEAIRCINGNPADFAALQRTIQGLCTEVSRLGEVVSQELSQIHSELRAGGTRGDECSWPGGDPEIIERPAADNQERPVRSRTHEGTEKPADVQKLLTPLSDSFTFVRNDLQRLEQSQSSQTSEVLQALTKIKTECLCANESKTIDTAPMMEAIKSIKVPDQEIIAGAVYDRIRRLNLVTRDDHIEILQAIRKSKVDFSPVYEAIGKIDVSADNGPVLDAIRKIKLPDLHVIATDVYEKLNKSGLPVDNSDLMKEIRRVRADIATIQAADVDLSPILEAVASLPDKANSDVLSAIRRVKEPDHDAVAKALHELLQRDGLVGVNLNPIQKAVADVRAKLDSSQAEVLLAVRKTTDTEQDTGGRTPPLWFKNSCFASQDDIVQVQREVKNLKDSLATSKVDFTPVLRAIGNIASQADVAELLKEVKRLKDSLDMSPLVNAIAASEVDLTPVLKAIEATTVDFSPVIAAIEQYTCGTRDGLQRQMDEGSIRSQLLERRLLEAEAALHKNRSDGQSVVELVDNYDSRRSEVNRELREISFLSLEASAASLETSVSANPAMPKPSVTLLERSMSTSSARPKPKKNIGFRARARSAGVWSGADADS